MERAGGSQLRACASLWLKSRIRDEVGRRSWPGLPLSGDPEFVPSAVIKLSSLPLSASLYAYLYVCVSM